MDCETLLRDLYATFNARALYGTLRADREVTHVYAFRDGLIVRMEVTEPREEGRPPARPPRPRA